MPLCRCQVDVEADRRVDDYYFFYITLFVPPADMEFASTQQCRWEIMTAALFLTETTSEGDFRTQITIERLDRTTEAVQRPPIGASGPCGQSPRDSGQGRPAESDTVGINNGFFLREQTISHDGLRFRSQGEIAIHDELKCRDVLFFPNAAAVLGTSALEYGKAVEKKEPDFLICYKGKWGILEINGEDFHSGKVKTTKDHERARRFKHYGLFCIEAFDYDKCRADPVGVVDEFLKLLANHK